jgi:hypothetical protein
VCAGDASELPLQSRRRPPIAEDQIVWNQYGGAIAFATDLICSIDKIARLNETQVPTGTEGSSGTRQRSRTSCSGLLTRLAGRSGSGRTVGWEPLPLAPIKVCGTRMRGPVRQRARASCPSTG